MDTAINKYLGIPLRYLIAINNKVNAIPDLIAEENKTVTSGKNKIINKKGSIERKYFLDLASDIHI